MIVTSLDANLWVAFKMGLMSNFMDKIDSTSICNQFQNLKRMWFMNFSSHSCHNLTKGVRTTILIPTSSLSSNIEPSKFVFNSLGFGGTQVCFIAVFWTCWITRLEVKSKRNLFATSLILQLGKVCAFSLVLFLWVQMNQAVVAKISGTRGFCRIQPTRSKNVPCKASKSFIELKSLLQTCFTASHPRNANLFLGVAIRVRVSGSCRVKSWVFDYIGQH